MAQDFEYVFTAANATFSLQGYKKKMHEVRRFECRTVNNY